MGLEFDPVMHKYNSIRYPIYARGGMVNCSSPQAAAAGLEALQNQGADFSLDPDIVRALREKGHDVRVDPDTASFGRGQIIIRLDNGVLAGGTESRTDSNIACC